MEYCHVEWIIQNYWIIVDNGKQATLTCKMKPSVNSFDVTEYECTNEEYLDRIACTLSIMGKGSTLIYKLHCKRHKQNGRKMANCMERYTIKQDL